MMRLADNVHGELEVLKLRRPYVPFWYDAVGENVSDDPEAIQPGRRRLKCQAVRIAVPDVPTARYDYYDRSRPQVLGRVMAL
mmetsp:Transcript_112998/g.284188  ORF Transcript_112998/g.284188 Transcript_112998/m.284188 type:complete len:82 (-) Transcript_112998:47-292(-)